MSINCLPDSLILKIFSYVRKQALCQGARRTCKRWWHISEDPSLWKELVIPMHFTDERLLLLMKQVGHHVQELECSLCEVVSCNVFLDFSQIAPEFTSLKKLSFPIEPSTNRSVDDVAEYFRKLSQIFPNLQSVENIVSLNTELTVNNLECQSQFSKLSSLYDNPTTSFGRISEVLKHRSEEKTKNWISNIKRVSEMCPEIKEYRCTKGSGYMDEIALELIGRLFQGLKTIELRYCNLAENTFEKLYTFFSGNNLKEIILEKPGQFTDNSLEVIANNSKNIKKIKLSRCPNITREGIKSLVSKCVNLTGIHINTSKAWSADGESNVTSDQIDDDCIEYVAQSCKCLESLRILHSTKLTSRGVHSLCIDANRLRVLMFFECPKIDDDALKDIAMTKSLMRLVLVNTGVSPRGVINLILDTASLKMLTLYCNADTHFDQDMTGLGEEINGKLNASDSYRPNGITSLSLRGVGSGFVQLITVLSPNLLSLDLRDSETSVTSRCIKSVLSNCEYLETLDISAKLTFNISLFEAIAEEGKSLRKLSLASNVLLFKTEDFLPMIQQCPCLEMIAMDIKGSNIDEGKLASYIQLHHGGNCYVHVDPSCNRDPQFNIKFTSFHFTPIIYADAA